MLRNYTRWTEVDAEAGVLLADILGARHKIQACPATGHVTLGDGDPMNPDEARMIGVRLIEAASLADGSRAIRTQPQEGGPHAQ